MADPDHSAHHGSAWNGQERAYRGEVLVTLPGALGEVLRERASAAAKTHAREQEEEPATTDAGEWTDDVLQLARQTVAVVMSGRGGRGAQSRLAAARLILDRDFLANISDAALEAELRRRLEARK